MNPVKEFLNAEMQVRKLMPIQHRIGNYSCPTEFILKHGREFRYSKLPKYISRGQMRECFKNAAEWVLLQDHPEPLFYCEGYASGIIPVHHAWICNARGEVLERTWKPKHQLTFYFGIPFKTKFLRERILETECWMSLIDDWQNGWPLLSLPADQWLETDVLSVQLNQQPQKKPCKSKSTVPS